MTKIGLYETILYTDDATLWILVPCQDGHNTGNIYFLLLQQEILLLTKLLESSTTFLTKILKNYVRVISLSVPFLRVWLDQYANVRTGHHWTKV